MSSTANGTIHGQIEPVQFPTANGTCTIDSYWITIRSLPVRPGSFGNWLANPQYQQWMAAALFLGMVALGNEALGFFGVERDWLVRFGLMIPLMAFILGCRYFTHPQVRRESINRVDLHPPKESHQRGRITVQFREKGYTKSSHIVAPKGRGAYEHMVQAMRAAGVIEGEGGVLVMESGRRRGDSITKSRKV